MDAIVKKISPRNECHRVAYFIFNYLGDLFVIAAADSSVTPVFCVDGTAAA